MNNMHNHSLRSNHAHRGFNLVEAAIVLGVIGLVIGGIWVAAATVTENNRKKEASIGILKIVEGVRTLYANLAPPTTSDVTAAMIRAGIVPADWVNGTLIRNPWGTGGMVEIGPDRVSVGLFEIPRASCIELVTRISNMVSNPNEITTGTNCDNPVAGRITVANATAMCSTYTLNDMQWNFGLRGGAPTDWIGLCS